MLGNEANLGVGGWIFPRVYAEEFDLAGAGSEFSHKELEQRGLPSPVHAQNTRHTPAQSKRDVTQGVNASVGFRNTVEHDHRDILGGRLGRRKWLPLLGHVGHHSRVTSIEATREANT